MKPVYEPGRWHGKGTDGTHAMWQVSTNRRAPGRSRWGRSHGYRAYWWYVHLDGTRGHPEWCEHAHLSRETAQKCGEREAAKRNRALERVRG